MTSQVAPRPAERGEGGRRPGEGLLVAILLLVAVVALAQSWQRWLDPIIDTGRDLYISERLFHGTTLYRDIRYQYPPLAPYLLAVATSIVGASLGAFTAIGIVQSIAIVALLWFALRGYGGFAAALLFVSLSATGASTWGANFIFPYAYAATLGMLFLSGALAAFIHERNAVAVACLVAASWCKLEYAAGAALIVGVLVVARRMRIIEAAVYLTAMIVTATIAIAYFGGGALRENIFAASLTRGDTARRFFRSVSGLDRWPHNLAIAAASAGSFALIAWLLKSRPRIGAAAAIVAALLFNSDSFMRGWALLQLVAMVIGFRQRNTPLIIFASFSIASTVRVALHVSPQWYGCAVIVPVYALAAYVMFASEYRSPWWFAIVAVICARDLVEQHERFSVKQFPIVTQRGTFYDYDAERAAGVQQVIRAVRGPTLAVFPEGVSINYFTRTPTPLSYYMLTPPETADAAAESRVLAELRARPPAEVVIVPRRVDEYGYRGFGVDYDREVMAYLTDKYAVIGSSRGIVQMRYMSR